MSDDKDIQLANGQVPRIVFIDYLKTLTPDDLDELYYKAAVGFTSATIAIENLEKVKDKYNVRRIIDPKTKAFVTSKFFDVLRKSYMAYNIYGQALCMLSPIGLKYKDFDLYRLIMQEPTEPFPMLENGQIVILQAVKNKYAGIEYENNVMEMLKTMREYPSIFLSESQRRELKSKCDQCQRDGLATYTLEPDDESDITDLVMYNHYLSKVKSFRKHYGEHEDLIYPREYEREVMRFAFNEKTGKYVELDRPVDTSMRDDVPDELIEKINETYKSTHEFLRDADDVLRKASAEFEHYKQLIVKKYPLTARHKAFETTKNFTY